MANNKLSMIINDLRGSIGCGISKEDLEKEAQDDDVKALLFQFFCHIAAISNLQKNVFIDIMTFLAARAWEIQKGNKYESGRDE